MTANIREIDAASYESAIVSSENVIIDFYSTECPPCEALASKYDALSLIFGDDVKFYKIFRQGNRELASSLGVSSSPTLIFYKNGKETAGRLSGGIKRSAMMSAIRELVPAGRFAELSVKVRPVTTECDVLVLGGGPAGLTAGIYLAQARLSVIVADTSLPGGYVSTTHLVSNYPGFIEPKNGYELAHFIVEQAKAAGVVMRPAADITAVDLDVKTILVDGHETIRAKKIVIATGSSPRPLGIPGEAEYRGNGISYCATCDAKYFDGNDVVVIGGGNSAVEESLFIAKYARHVTIVHQFAELQANKLSQEKAFSNERIDFMFEHEPREFRKHGPMDMEVIIENLKTGTRSPLKAHGVFVFVGFTANTLGFGELLILDKFGYIVTDDEMRTGIDGVYAAGDIRSKRYRQITTAVSDGTIAAISISKTL